MNDVVPIAIDQTTERRPIALIFVADADSEGVLRQSLNDIGVTKSNMDIVSGDVQKAIEVLSRTASPRLLIVDISGRKDPERELSKLAEVCEPNTGVVVIGDRNDIRLYRELKRRGVSEYFFKPLVRDMVAQTCSGILSGTVPPSTERIGRLVFFLGVRGGVGATTVAVSTAWHIAELHKRGVMLVDLDLYGGDAALQLDSTPSHALTEALARPDRIDELFLERGTIHVTPRLDLLASLESLNQNITVEDESMFSLLDVLLHRYRYVIVDLPPAIAGRLMQVLHLPSLCVFVSTGSLVAARDAARWRDYIGPNTPERTSLLVLNQSSAPGSLPLAEFTRVAGAVPDIIVPHLRDVETASKFGIKGIVSCAGFQGALDPLFRQLTGVGKEARPSLLTRLFG
jgi:pilus assembly protein CpaE